MKERVDEQITEYDLFVHTHKKKAGGEFVQERAREVDERYRTMFEERQSQCDSVDTTQLFYDAVGGHDKKQRVYGLGSCSRSIPRPNATQSTTSAARTSAGVAFDMGELERLVEERVEQRVEQRLEERVEEMREVVKKDLEESLDSRVQDEVRRVLAAFMPPLPSSSQPPQPTPTHPSSSQPPQPTPPDP